MGENLYNIRHSLAHLLAIAALEHDPKAKLSVGPVTDNGFYYDIDFSEGKEPTPENLKAFEKTMYKMINKKMPFIRQEVSVQEARERFSDNPYKLAIIDDIETSNEAISLYSTGEFVDLCEGRHVENTSEIDAKSFMLTHLAGAYWRGDEKNPMLTRIYGLAFSTASELKDHLAKIEEAKKRDHKKLGKELGLFMFHETSPGMPYWLPKGLIVYNELVNYWRAEHAKLNYQEISSPLVNKAELWKISGHWDHYKDDMFIADMGENEIYGIKPMNCPNAMVVFKSMQISYRDLPYRLSDTDRLHRYERSGTLNGLLRVRSFQQDDSHNFISEEMIESEIESIFEICKRFYGIFNLEYSFRLGTRPEKFLGEVAIWDKAEAVLKAVLEKSGQSHTTLEGDGAFYGPKIDIVMKDCLGREWQMGTIQLDFQLPGRFELFYTDKDGTKKTPVVIHRVIYGSLERFLGILIEHTAGAFPVWLAPVQATVLPIGEKHHVFAQEITTTLKEKGLRVELDMDNESLGKRVRNAKMQKIPYLIIIGDKEMEAKTVSLEHRSEGSLGTKTIEECIELLTQTIASKK